MERLFLNPTNAYRAKPFWAWNGELQEEELKRQIDAFEEMGFGGYFMHSRVGLKTEYLGEEWFRLINACADYGNTKGMENWIYDEDRWPSGPAGGLVTQDPAYRMKHIRMNRGPVEPDARVLGCFSGRVEGKNIYDVRPVAQGSPEATVWFEVITRPEHSNYNGGAYLDTMSRQATEAFLDSTHRAYVRECGSRIGSSILGVFTDEPHRGELLVDVHREGLQLTNCIPYTEELFDRFLQDWGYDLREHLPALFFLEEGAPVSQVKWHYCETLQRLFLENYVIPISRWCRRHGMIYTGHMLHEDTLASQTLMTGSLMRCYEHMDYPGVDLLGNSNVNYNIVKQVASVARQCGKEWILSEMYGVSGWQMTLEDYKRIGDWQALLGVNLRCPHLSWYTMAGECKRDYPASISFQSGWYRAYKHLEDYFARLGVFMSQGAPVGDVLVLNPVESMWCGFYPGWARWLVTQDRACLELERSYRNLAQFLVGNNVEYDYGDEEMISRLARVEGDTLILGRAAYKKVIIPKMWTIRSTTVKILERFQAHGGRVIVYEDLPGYVDAQPATVHLGNGTMAEILADRVLTVEHEKILTALRKGEDGRYFAMILNTDAQESVSAPWRLPQGFVEEWDPETGGIFGLDRTEEITLAPGQMRLLVLGGPERAARPQEELPALQLPDTFRYSLSAPNVLVVDRVTCRCDGGETTDDVLKMDIRLRKKAGLPARGGEMPQPWYMAKKEPVAYFDFELRYEFDALIDCDGQIATEATGHLEINGQPITLTDQWWTDPCFKTAPIRIRKGRNVVTVRDTFTGRQDLEAIYILGAFGVFGGIIDKQPDRIRLGDITGQGFPHYGGTVTYSFPGKVADRSMLHLPDLGGGAALRVNGRLLAWAPYRVAVEPCDAVEIELILTGRNTFGPLHQLPARTSGCGPRNFLTTGEHWTDDMVTLPCGLNL